MLVLLVSCTIWFEYFHFFPYQMRQQASADGQPVANLPNGPSDNSPNHAGLSCTCTLSHTAIQPTCVTQPTVNGCTGSASPSAGLSGHLDKKHAFRLADDGASNGNMPYQQQNSLPHNCTATSHPNTSSTTGSPSHADRTWKSQQCNITTQVFLKF